MTFWTPLAIEGGRDRAPTSFSVLVIEAFCSARARAGRVGLGLFALGDVARDLRGADDDAVLVADGRHGERDRHQSAVLALANRLEVVHLLAAAQARKDFVFLGLAIGGKIRRIDWPIISSAVVAEDPLGRCGSSSSRCR